MAAVNIAPAKAGIVSECYLQNFMLYETRSKFYMVGRDETKTSWRVLKVDRLEPFELNICEDSTTYSESECNNLLKRINDGNKPTGGLKFVTSCYGIVGFVKFLGPYYMLLITKRRLIGDICGHNVYAVTKSSMITVPNSSIRSNMSIPKTENRYKKLLSTVDLTKDFFFSYSYHVMRSLQENLCDFKTGQVVYENMFVWNEFLTRGIHNCLKNTLWTVALVYGFFTQRKLSITGKDFRLTLMARRSRLYAGTRYLKRGVNDKGNVANDVETEQIVFEDGEGTHTQISSIIQNRGSIPLHWSQETSKMNMKPDIILQKDAHFEATRLHFKNLVKRYGNPIIILNLIKTQEKKPRESILRAEFANAIDFLNKDLSEENRLRFLHWDLHKHMRRKAANVLLLLGKVAACALYLTGFFHCQVTSILRLDNGLKWPYTLKDNAGLLFCKEQGCNINYGFLDDNDMGNSGLQENEDNPKTAARGCLEYNTEGTGNNLVKLPMIQTGVLRTNCIDCLDRIFAFISNAVNVKDNAGLLFCKEQGCNINYGFLDDNDMGNSGLQENEDNPKTAARGCLEYNTEGTGNNLVKLPMIQTGVLRTNCIDCLDRTNVAQYAYGLASLGHQLHALGLIDDPKLDLDGSLSNELMQFYERMGDTLALQYGGSAAHNKVFSERRGQWKTTTQSQEFFRTLQRYYNNAYMDAEKQKAINLFLGYFKPEQDKVVIWEMDSDQHYFVSKHNNSLGIETPRPTIKRSLSDGSILQQNKTPLSHCFINNGEFPKSVLSDKTLEAWSARRLSDSTPEISAYQRDIAFSRLIPTLPCRRLFVEGEHGYLSEPAFDASTFSNFLDLDRLSSYANSCEEAYERSTAGSTVTNSPVTILSTDSCVNGFATDAIPSLKGADRAVHSTNGLWKESEQNQEFSDSFVNWVIHGETLSSR